jgi:predicted small secreted protein
VRIHLRACISTLALLACACWVAACNTVRGAGEDLRQAGEATERAVNDLTR